MSSKENITKETVGIAVLEKRIELFETYFKEFKVELHTELSKLATSNETILLKINTLETKQRVYIAVFGVISGFIGSCVPSMLKAFPLFLFW